MEKVSIAEEIVGPLLDTDQWEIMWDLEYLRYAKLYC